MAGHTKMAQTGFTPISNYYSATATNVPTAGNLIAGELAINTADGKLFYKDSSGVVQTLATKDATSGSFTNLAYTGTLTGGTGVVNLGSGQFYKDATGNVGIGATPSAWGGTAKAVELPQGCSIFGFSSGTPATNIYANAYYNGTNVVYKATGLISAYQLSAGAHQWYYAPSGTAGTTVTLTKAMELNTVGNLRVNTASDIDTNNPERLGVTYTNPQTGMALKNLSTANTYAILFSNPNGIVGSITSSGTTTAYNTSSDYRLKENIVPMTDALTKVSALKPVTYTWKADGSSSQGFIAHELAEVCPEAVNGEKDAINEDGSIKPQGIDTSFLVATLTAAIQELNAKVDAQANTIEFMQSKLKDAGILGF